MNISRFSLISPLDHRYYFSNQKLFDSLQNYLSEDANLKYCIKVELSLLETLAPYFKLSKSDVAKARDNAKKITIKEVYKEEIKTQHNIRAVVNVIKKHMPKSVAPFIHLGATSFDITDTAWSMRLRDVSYNVIIPELLKVQKHLITLAEKNLSVPQVGRTHGQYAVPITVGHTFAEYISRIGNSIEELYLRAKNLTGKLSGAVGAYNALSLITPTPLKVESEHLKRLQLNVSEYSSQISSPEPALRLLLEYNTAFGIIANLADDLRNLQRSEIAEVYEHFSKTQVGSSTMPQKRNPWNSEHVKSLYKTFCPRILTMYNDQISEHQSDFTNSASLRFVCEYLAGFSAATVRMSSILKHLQIDLKNIRKNLLDAGQQLLAEAIYILLAIEGENNSHEIVRTTIIKTKNTKKSITEILQNDKKTWKKLEKGLSRYSISSKLPQEFFNSPENYIGCAVLRSKKIINKYKAHIIKIQKNLTIIRATNSL